MAILNRKAKRNQNRGDDGKQNQVFVFFHIIISLFNKFSQEDDEDEDEADDGDENAEDDDEEDAGKWIDVDDLIACSF